TRGAACRGQPDARPAAGARGGRGRVRRWCRARPDVRRGARDGPAARRYGSPPVGAALKADGRSGPDGVHERLELAERMFELGQAEHDDDTTLWGWLWRFDAFMMLGRLDEAEATLGRMWQLTERLRRPLALWHYLRSKAAVKTVRGRFGDAVTTMDDCRRLVPGRTHDSVEGVR